MSKESAMECIKSFENLKLPELSSGFKTHGLEESFVMNFIKENPTATSIRTHTTTDTSTYPITTNPWIDITNGGPYWNEPYVPYIAPYVPSVWPIDIKYDYKFVYKPLNEKEEKMYRRIVKVVVFDPDVRVCDEDSELYMSDFMITSKSDEEISHDLDFKTMLAKHNKKRKETLDEDRTDELGREVKLRPIKFSDLEVQIIEID